MANIPLLLARNIKRWESATFKPASLRVARQVAARLVAPKAKAIYQKLETLTGVPWFAVAMIHEREASQKWDRSIAQGDPWNRKSIHIPKGRGPFKSFIDAAVDALVNCAPYASKWKDWSPGGMLTLQEMYNGLGYANKNRPSAYIWSGTNQYVKGKYVADRVYDPNVVDTQLGCAVMLKAMMEADDSIYAKPVAFAEVVNESADEGDQLDPAQYPEPKDAVPLAPDKAPAGDDPASVVPPQVSIPTPAPVGRDVQGDPDTYSIQSRLKEMNYNPGLIDGKWGGNTSGAISGFINDRHLTISAPTSIDEFNAVREALKVELGRAEAESFKRPVSEERKSGDAAVVAQVAPEVVPVKQNFLVTAWGAVVAFFAAIWNALSDQVAAAWNFFTDHKDSLPTDSGFLKTVWGYVTSVPSTIWIILGGVGLVLIAINSRRAVNKINESVQTGARQ